MRFGLFVLVAIPLYITWIVYHVIKGNFASIKNDAIIGGLFLGVSGGLYYWLFV